MCLKKSWERGVYTPHTQPTPYTYIYNHVASLTMGLDWASLCLHFRYHRIGILVLFLHDVNDIFLEFSKLCVSFKSRGGKYHVMSDILSGVGFLTFASLW